MCVDSGNRSFRSLHRRPHDSESLAPSLRHQPGGGRWWPAGMEAVVSYLKRCFGLRRCNWRGLEHFRAYVWSAVVTHNLWVIARRKLKLKPA